jgi:hypothetical protein
MRKLFTIFFLGIILSIAVNCPALAQSSSGIAITPPTFELSANPGDTLENTIRVSNLNDTPMPISVSQQNFTAIGEEGDVGLTDEETSYSLASWISVAPAHTTIPAKSSSSFTFKIKTPLNAEPGGHFGSILFRVGGQNAPGQTGAVVAQELGALVLLKIAGKSEEQASLETFTTPKLLWEYGPVEFEMRVKNSGNVHLKPMGTITLINFFGQKVAAVPIETRNILPGAVRRIPATWPQKFLFGKYTATVSVIYGNQGKIMTASTTFFGFPYKIGGVVLVVLLILGIIIYRRRRRIGLAVKILFGR